MKFHCDLKGIATLALTGTCGLTAYLTDNNHIFALFSLLLAVTLVSTVMTILSSLRIDVRRRFTGDFFATEEFTYSVILVNRKWFIPSFMITVADRMAQELHRESTARVSKPHPFLGPGRSATIELTVVPLYRGPASFARIHLLTQFPLSPMVVERIIPAKDSILVFPRLFNIDRRFLHDITTLDASISAEAMRYTGGDDEFAGLHEFRTGDNPRHIHWKTSARLQDKLMVREMESNRVRDAVIILDPQLPLAPESAPELRRRLLLRVERAIGFTATLMTILSRRNYRLTIVSADERGGISEEIEPSRGGIARLNTLLAGLRPSVSPDIAGAFHRDRRSHRSSFASFLITARRSAGIPVQRNTIVITPTEMKRLIIREAADAEEAD